MKKIICLSLMLVSSAVPSFALDKDVDMEIRRVEQRMMRMFETNKQLLQDVRDLQRKNDKLTKGFEDVSMKYDALNDQVLKLRNVDIANLRVGQKGLYDQIPLFTWGEDTEDCADIETKHQQINTQKSADGSQTMRFLCFDGKAVHMGTEYHGVPK
ncbi:MAG: putative RNase H-like nuclease (RuvC/YqgF family) [Alphaproteobacteria bacterium]|jgi:predicted RNase H-like nuclease (RuvC/YqgF family)